MKIVNLDLVGHPLNWLTLATWVLSFAVLAHVLGLTTNVLQDPPNSKS